MLSASYVKEREVIFEDKYDIIETYFNKYKELKHDVLIHADLHLKNIIREKETNDIVVIDFDDLRKMRSISII